MTIYRLSHRFFHPKKFGILNFYPKKFDFSSKSFFHPKKFGIIILMGNCQSALVTEIA